MNEPLSRKGFNWRGFTSLLLAAGFLILAGSGLVLYASPRGRVANWTDWEVLGLTKHEWGGCISPLPHSSS